MSINVGRLVAAGVALLMALPPGPASGGGTRHFRRVADDWGIAGRPTRTWGAVIADIDSDGWSDLLLGRHLKSPKVFLGSERGLRRVRYPALEDAPRGQSYYDRHTCAFGEADGHPEPDLYCVSGARGGEGTGPNQLLLQEDGGLRDVARRWGVRDELGRGRSINWLDYDSDGDLDLFVGNEERRGHPNVMFQNTRGGFEIADAGVDLEMGTVSSSWSDWDRDGDPDLVVLGHGYVGSVFLENTDASFSSRRIDGVSGVELLSAAWGDYDGDGWGDLLVTGRRRAAVLRNLEGQSLVEVATWRLAAGRAGKWIDIGSDGDLDIVVVQGRTGRSPLDDPAGEEAADRPDLLIEQAGGAFVAPTKLHRVANGNGEDATIGDLDGDLIPDVLVTAGYLEDAARPIALAQVTAGATVGVQVSDGSWNPWGLGAHVEVTADGIVQTDELTDEVVFHSQSSPGRTLFGIGTSTVADVVVTWPDGERSCMTVQRGQVALIQRGGAPCSPIG
ncbi:MAG TPA: CRTAC1 family protein [Actinomycetota bacterium]|nr:CRTAC1 family protein [Actinomycetota bacterium]